MARVKPVGRRKLAGLAWRSHKYLGSFDPVIFGKNVMSLSIIGRAASGTFTSSATLASARCVDVKVEVVGSKQRIVDANISTLTSG